MDNKHKRWEQTSKQTVFVGNGNLPGFMKFMQFRVVIKSNNRSATFADGTLADRLLRIFLFADSQPIIL